MEVQNFKERRNRKKICKYLRKLSLMFFQKYSFYFVKNPILVSSCFSSNSCDNWLLKIKVHWSNFLTGSPLSLFQRQTKNFQIISIKNFRANQAFCKGFERNWKLPQVLCFVYRVKIPQKKFSRITNFFFQSQTFKKGNLNPQKIFWISTFERFNQTKRKKFPYFLTFQNKRFYRVCCWDIMNFQDFFFNKNEMSKGNEICQENAEEKEKLCSEKK